MILRILILLIVSFAGCVVFYARRDLTPSALLRIATVRGLVVSLYVALAYVGMQLVTSWFIDA